MTAGQLSSFLPKAFKLMKTGRPGPVHIEVPYDVYQLEAETVVADPIDWSDSIAWRTGAEDRVIGSILQKLKEAKRPLILAGGGVNHPLPRNSCGYLRRR